MTDPPRRVHFFDGRMLTAEDLSAEQAYHREMRHLHNRLHGHGVVSGLHIAEVDGDIQVSPGVAIDGLGRELVLTVPQRVPFGWRRTDPGVLDLVLVWGEDFDGQVPGPDGQPVAAWVVERPRVEVARPDETPEAAVLLARLSRTHRGVAVDLEVRRHIGPDRPL